MPALPFLTKLVLLPENTKIRSLRTVLRSPHRFPGEIRPEFVRPDNAEERDWVEEGPDSTIYLGEAPFPPFDQGRDYQGSYRGYRLARVSVYPLKYIGRQRRLELATDIELIVRLERMPTKEASSLRLRPDRLRSRAGYETDWLRRNIINPNDVDGFYRPNRGDRVDPLVDEDHADAGFNPTDTPSLAGSPVDCVILTNNTSIYGEDLGNMEGALQVWADWKTKSGTPTVVRTVDWVRSHFEGADDPERIRSFLRAAYSYWGTDWVIIGGDIEVVPCRFLTTDTEDTRWEGNSLLHMSFGDSRDLPAEFYYSELDADWNSDDDSFYGDEMDADYQSFDPFPDLWLGQLPVRNEAEVAGVVRKLKAYCRTSDYQGAVPTDSYYTNLLLAAGFTNGTDTTSAANGILEAEKVRETALSAGWQTDRYYPLLPTQSSCNGVGRRCFAITKDGVSDSLSDPIGVFNWANVLSALGVTSLHHYQGFFHCEHSAVSGLGGPFDGHYWPAEEECGDGSDGCVIGPVCNAWRTACGDQYYELNKSGFGTIDRGRLGTIANAPYYGIYVTRGSATAAHEEDAVSEAAVRNPDGGAIAYLGRIVSATYGTQVPSAIDVGIWSKLLVDGLPFGVALPEAREDCSNVWPERKALAAIGFHLLGDPELHAWRHAPDTLAVSASVTPNWTLGFGEIEVNVTDADQQTPIEGAIVCCMQGTQFWARAETNAGGMALFPRVLMTELGSVTVTVVTPDYLPRTVLLPYLGQNEPGVLVYAGHSWSDAADPGTTTDVLEAGDYVDLALVLRNPGATNAGVLTSRPVYITGSGGVRMTSTFGSVFDSGRIRLGPKDAGGNYANPPSFAPSFHLPLHEYGISILAEVTPQVDSLSTATYLWRDGGPDFIYHLKIYWSAEVEPTTTADTLLIDGGATDLTADCEATDSAALHAAASPAEPDTLIVAFEKDGTGDIDEVTFRAGLDRWLSWVDNADSFTAGSYTPGDTAVMNYEFKVAPGFHDEQPLSFVVSWKPFSLNQAYPYHFTEFQTIAHAPDIQLLFASDSLTVPACSNPELTRYKIVPTLVNRGSVAADSLSVEIWRISGTGALFDSVTTIGSLAPGEMKAAPTPFCMCAGYVDPLVYGMQVLSPIGGDTWEYWRRDDLTPFTERSPVGFVQAEPEPKGIRVLWESYGEPRNFVGYAVLRDSSGVVSFVSEAPIMGVTRYEVHDPQVVDAQDNPIPYVFGVAMQLNCGTLGQIVWADTCFANPPEVAGWPVQVERGGVRSIAVYDLDEDVNGDLEILAAGQILSGYNSDGSPLAGSVGTLFAPSATGARVPEFVPEIAVGQLAPSQSPSVVGVYRNDTVYCIDSDSWSTRWSHSLPAAVGPTLANLDQDANGTLEVIVPSREPEVYAWDASGAPLRSGGSGRFVENDEGSTDPPAMVAVGDLHPSDGQNADSLEIVQTTLGGFIYCWKSSQPAQWNDTSFRFWKTNVVNPVDPDTADARMIGVPVIGDIDPDHPGDEIAMARCSSSELLVQDGDGPGNWWHSHRWHTWALGDRLCDADEKHVSSVAIGDLGGPSGPDGRLELIASKDSTGLESGPMGRHEIVIANLPEDPGGDPPYDLNFTYCYDWLPLEWRKGLNAGVAGSPVIADIDGDEKQEIILASAAHGVFIWEATYDSGREAFNCTAELGWPLRLLEEAATPVVADVDADGCLELVIGDNSGLIHLFDLPGACVLDAQWPMAGADPQRTGNLGGGSNARALTESGPRTAGPLPPKPNPFRPRVTLRYQMPYRAHAEAEILDVTGRRVVTLADGTAEAGLHELVWDGRDGAGHPVGSGVYFARFSIAGYRSTQKLTLVR